MTGARMRAALVLLIVFAAGALAGVAFERHHAVPTPTAMTTEEEQTAAMAELREVAGLDDQQAAAIHAILAEHQDVVQHMWEQLRPEVQGAMLQVHSEIAELLRPDQRERFHDWIQRQREHHLGRHH